MLFKQGNTKLGRRIYTFSIPAGDTCPGKTGTCGKECYAAEGFFVMPNVARSHLAAYNVTKSPSFVEDAVAELKKIKAKVVRVHVAGDLYSRAYAQKWLAIFRKSPQCRFFIYTRSWRIKDIRPVITKMSKLPNVRMWWSVDKDTGRPRSKPKTARLAYMQVDHSDIPIYKVDLFFRTGLLRDRIIKSINKGLVCPVENGVTKDMNCMKCGFCWRDKGETITWNQNLQRMELPLLK